VRLVTPITAAKMATVIHKAAPAEARVRPRGPFRVKVSGTGQALTHRLQSMHSRERTSLAASTLMFTGQALSQA
jgi:hypothetical protein